MESEAAETTMRRVPAVLAVGVGAAIAGGLAWVASTIAHLPALQTLMSPQMVPFG